MTRTNSCSSAAEKGATHTMIGATRQHEAERLYAQYVKPLEPQHTGQYIAISSNGQTLLGSTVLEVMQQAKAAFGPGSFIFKVGDRSMGKWR